MANKLFISQLSANNKDAFETVKVYIQGVIAYIAILYLFFNVILLCIDVLNYISMFFYYILEFFPLYIEIFYYIGFSAQY